MKLLKYLYTGPPANIGRHGMVSTNATVFLTEDEANSVQGDSRFTNIECAFDGSNGDPNGVVVGSQGDKLWDPAAKQWWTFDGPNGKNGWRIDLGETSPSSVTKL